MEHSPILRIPKPKWEKLLEELHRRTQCIHESGAFLLGSIEQNTRTVEDIFYYDDLDSQAYRTGIVTIHGSSFGLLWDHCRSRKLSVVADVHCHPKGAWQSIADRNNPMIAQRGHLALIIPYFARSPVRLETLGFFEYQGAHSWRDLSGNRIRRHLFT